MELTGLLERIRVLSDYYFFKIRYRLKEIVDNCNICKEAKYQRHPPKQEIGPTSIPSYSGKVLHMEIYLLYITLSDMIG